MADESPYRHLHYATIVVGLFALFIAVLIAAEWLGIFG